MTWTRPGFEAVARLVGKRTGLTFPPRLRPTVEDRIRRAMRDRSVPDPFRYRDLLASDAEAFDALVAELTVGETYFFREPEQLDFIRTRVLPELARNGPPSRALRVWSAGCASGEEAYSMAILLRDAGLGDRASILGTDISLPRLARARRARYSAWSLRGVPEEIVRRDFRRHGKQYQLRGELREAVTFRPLNLAEESYPSLASGAWEMDLVLCRNVLIYLDPEVVAGVARRLMRSLSERGWLFLGASDPPLSGMVECEVVVTGSGVAYRRKPRARRPSAEGAIPAGAPPSPVPERDRPPIPGGEARRPAAPAPVPVPEEGTPADPAEVASLYAARDYARAADRAQALLEHAPTNPDLWILRVRALANQGKLAEAGRACSAALEHCRTSAELMYLHALLLSSARHVPEAIAAARRALYLDRRLVMAHVVLGDLLLRQGSREAARTALRNAERLLAGLPAEEVVPASDGESAGTLLQTVRLHLKLSGADDRY